MSSRQERLLKRRRADSKAELKADSKSDSRSIRAKRQKRVNRVIEMHKNYRGTIWNLIDDSLKIRGKKSKKEYKALFSSTLRSYENPRDLIQKLSDDNDWTNITRLINSIRVADMHFCYCYGDDESLAGYLALDAKNANRDKLFDIIYSDNTYIDYSIHIDGSTLLMSACRRLDIVIVRKLIERGCDVNSQDVEGYTALMYVYSICEDKIDYKAEFENAEDKQLRQEITQLLLDANCDISLKTFNVDTIPEKYREKTAAELIAVIKGNNQSIIAAHML